MSHERMTNNQPEYKYYVVDINGIYIDSGWEYREDAMDRAKEFKDEGGVPKICPKGRVAVGDRKLDPDDDACWHPIRNAEQITGVRGRGVSTHRPRENPRKQVDKKQECRSNAEANRLSLRLLQNDNVVDASVAVLNGKIFVIWTEWVDENPLMTSSTGQPRRFGEAFGHARTAGRSAHAAYRAMRGRPVENPRLNPSQDASRDEERGAKVFEMWHKKDASGSLVKRVLSDADSCMVPVGRAQNIVYRSGKWEKGRRTNDYIHTFDSHPTVYMLERFANESRAQGKSAASLLRACQGSDGRFVVAELATPLSFSLADGTVDGQEIAIHNGSKLYGSADKKVVIICDPTWKLIVVKGGRMRFDERGIVY